MNESFCFSTSLPEFGGVSVPDFDHSNTCAVVVSCCFNLHFPDGMRWSVFIFYWSIVDLQCTNLCCTAKWLSNTCIYVLFLIFFFIMGYHGLLNILCYELGPCCLSILNVTVRIFNPRLAIHPSPPQPWPPAICSLFLWVCFWIIDRFTCAAF